MKVNPSWNNFSDLILSNPMNISIKRDLHRFADIQHTEQQKWCLFCKRITTNQYIYSYDAASCNWYMVQFGWPCCCISILTKRVKHCCNSDNTAVHHVCDVMHDLYTTATSTTFFSIFPASVSGIFHIFQNRKSKWPHICNRILYIYVTLKTAWRSSFLEW